MNATTFECYGCKQVLSVSRLSNGSWALADTDTRTQAVLVLAFEELYCDDCDIDIDEEEEVAVWGEVVGRNDIERFELSGVHVDPARWQAHQLNY